MTAEGLSRWDSLLPPEVRAIDTWQGDEHPVMHRVEERFVGDAGFARRGEFAAGRWCARRALELLGVAAQPISRRADGVALWPPEVVGSITHSHGYVAAAAGLTGAVLTLGIDAEPHHPASGPAVARIATQEESRHLAELARTDPTTHWGRVLFSAKEAAFKAWYPLTQTPLRFRDISITFDPGGSYTARIAPMTENQPTVCWDGRWSCSDLVLTAVVVPPGCGQSSGDSVAC